MELEDRIKLVISYKQTVDKWKNNFTSVEYKEASKLNKILYGVELNKVKNCSCINDLLYLIGGMTKEKIQTKIKQMESKFKLKPNKVIQVHGLGIILTNSNLTDEKAIALLDKYPAHIISFEEFPDDWNKKKKVEKMFEELEKEIVVEPTQKIEFVKKQKKSRKK